jgi:cobalamin synthase
VVVAYATLQERGLAVVLVVMVIVALVGAYIARQLGGLTGDAYGALGELAEAAVLVAMSPVVLLAEVLG